MKPKLLLCLALVLSGCLFPPVVHGFWAEVAVHPNDITSMTPFVRVIGSHPFGTTNNLRVMFYVYVLPKDKQTVRSLWAELCLQDNDGHFIDRAVMQPKENSGSVPDVVPKSWAGRCVQFEFMVATNYLSHSEFDLNETIDPKLGSAGTVYQFNLKKFAAVK